MRETRTVHLIVGNSAAAIGAIEAIREAGDRRKITLVSDEPEHTYARHLISYYLTGKTDRTGMQYRPASFYGRMGVAAKLGERAETLDPTGQAVILSSGEMIRYETLLLAVGARPLIPRLEGLAIEKAVNVFTFTALAEVERIRKFLETNAANPEMAGAAAGRRLGVVVIGGGLIGLQAAEALHHLGAQVSIVELAPRILMTVTDERACHMVEARLAAAGVDMYTGVSARELIPHPGAGDRVGGVRLSDGRVLSADMVILAVGVVPRTELVEGSRMRLDRGIPVDEFMQTSFENIWAAGDVALATRLPWGDRKPVQIWPNAHLQGRTAGFAMAGKPRRFTGALPMNSAHFFGLPVASAGIFDPEPGSSCEILEEYRPGDEFYKKLVISGGRIMGVLAAGDGVDRIGVAAGLIRRGTVMSAAGIQAVFRDFSLASFPPSLRKQMIFGAGEGSAERWSEVERRAVS